MIAPNVILPFDGNHADIPSGYTRETTLDGLYPKATADSTDPDDTGGNATHTHTSSNNHTHTLNAHTHTYTTSSYTGTGDTTGSSGSNWYIHSHTGTSGTLASTYTSSISNPNFSSASNEPPYYTVIFIKANGYTLIPQNGIVLNSETSRSGMDFHTASANKYLKGAGTGADAGSTGGSTTHAHTFTHNHGNISHNHSTANSNTGTGNGCGSENSGANQATSTHVHSVSFTAANAPTVNHSTSYDFTGIEPEYRTLNAFKASSSTTPIAGDIAMWLGSLASIPAGWNLCDGTNDTPDMRGKFLKIPSSASESNTGGNNTHTHSKAHTHSTSNHTHAFTTATSSGTGPYGSGSGTDRWSYHHNHGSGTTASQGAGTTGSGTINANSSNNEPEYRTVAYLQFEYAPVIPNPIIGMLIDKL